jgi:post-segregation antitoxin (ccd killing protein)
METINRRGFMSEKLGKARSFRQWLKNEERLEKAEKLDLNVSELINQAVDKALSQVLVETLKKRKEETERALATLG